MATNLLVIPGGSGGLVRFNGGVLPVALETFQSAGNSDLLLTVAGTAGDNPQLLGDEGNVNAVVKSSASVANSDLVCKVNETTLVQLIKTDGTEPLLCTPVQKQNL